MHYQKIQMKSKNIEKHREKGNKSVFSSQLVNTLKSCNTSSSTLNALINQNLAEQNNAELLHRAVIDAINSLNKEEIVVG